MTELQENLNQTILKRINQQSDNINDMEIKCDTANTKRKLFMDRVAPLIASLYARNVLDLSGVLKPNPGKKYKNKLKINTYSENKYKRLNSINAFKMLNKRLNNINKIEIKDDDQYDRKKLFMDNVAPTMTTLFLRKCLDLSDIIVKKD